MAQKQPTLDGCCDKRGLPVVSGRKKMQKMVATTWHPAKRRYTPHSILQSMVKKLCSMMAPFSRETSTVIPWPRHLVSRGWTSAEMTQPVQDSKLSGQALASDQQTCRSASCLNGAYHS